MHNQLVLQRYFVAMETGNFWSWKPLVEVVVVADGLVVGSFKQVLGEFHDIMWRWL